MCCKETEHSGGSQTIYYWIWYQLHIPSFILNCVLEASVYTGIKSFTDGTSVLNISALLAGRIAQLPYAQSQKPATWKWRAEIRNILGPSYPSSPLSLNFFSSVSSRIDRSWSCKNVTFQLSLALLWIRSRVRLGLCVQKSGQNVLCTWHKRIRFWTYCKTSLNKFLGLISSVSQYHAVSIAALNLWIRPPDWQHVQNKGNVCTPQLSWSWILLLFCLCPSAGIKSLLSNIRLRPHIV